MTCIGGLHIPKTGSILLTAKEVKEVEDHIEQLEAENAKLCAHIDGLCAEVERTKHEQWDMGFRAACDAANVEHAKTIDYYEAENAKLRELAVLNWEWAHSCCANSCKMQTDGCGYGIDRECNYEREIADLMRDLGIETGE